MPVPLCSGPLKYFSASDGYFQRSNRCSLRSSKTNQQSVCLTIMAEVSPLERLSLETAKTSFNDSF